VATFPENDVEILPDYFPVAPVEKVAAELTVPGVTPSGGVPPPELFADFNLSLTPSQRNNQRRAADVFAARRRLQTFLKASPGTMITKLEAITDHFKRRAFAKAAAPLTELQQIQPVTNVTIDRQTIDTALTRGAISYFGISIHRRRKPQPGENGPSEVAQKVPRTLKAYVGPAPSGDLGELFPALRDFLTSGSERRFRLQLLLAERLVGEAQAEEVQSDHEALYRQAIRAYALLLPDPPSGLSAQQRVVVVRSVTAQAALADFLFRRAFRPNQAKREEIVKLYGDALTFAVRFALVPGGVGTDKYAGLLTHIQDQMDRLKNGVNVLGYTDSYVPNLKLRTLSAQALERISAAEAASAMFRELERDLDAVLQQIAELQQDELEREVGVQIASLREANASAVADKARLQTEAIESKQNDLDLSLAVGLGESVLTNMALAASTGTVSGPGMASTLVGYQAASNELGHQLEISRTEERIAANDKRIAGHESDIAESRLAFVRDTLDSRQFRANRLYALTNAWEALTRRHAAAALEALFLFERGIAFRRFNDPQIVQGASSDPLFAPGELREMHTHLATAALADGEGQSSFPLPPISLRTRYPIEFHRFRQDGRMEFVISLYDVERHMRLNGHSNIRIKKVEVDISGLIPPTGFIGTLIHRGVMMFRDLDATMTEPRPERLLPTADEVEAAISKLERGGLRAIAGGVALLALDEDTLRFSSRPQEPLPTDELDFELEPIENYGLTGTWFLQVDGMNVHDILDVRLLFTVSFEERDTELAARVDELIAAYDDELRGQDQLDLIQAFSLSERFSDAFLELETGQAAFELREEDFEPGITDLKVKTVIAQALDDERNAVEGLALEISKPGTSLSLARTSGPDGFSEDLSGEIPTVPIPERPLIVGTWQVQLPDPGQFARMGEDGDLLLFFVYEFRQIAPVP
jgi:hypothetical protein